jgi:hypothetical protein
VGQADQLTTGRTIGMTGDVTWTSNSFNGTANVTGTSTLANTGVTAGTYTKVTVDAKGRITTGNTLSSSDIPTLNQNTTGSAATATTATNVSGGTANVTTLTTSSTVTHNGGTAAGVAYLNGSKVLTTGSALTFDGGKFEINSAYVNANSGLNVTGSGSSATGTSLEISYGAVANTARLFAYDRTGAARKDIQLDGLNLLFNASGSEGMRLTSTGLGIGTSSPGAKLDVAGGIQANSVKVGTTQAIITSGMWYQSGTAQLKFSPPAGGFGWNRNANDAEIMALTDSGNLGLGVTPSAWGSGYKAIQIANYAAFAQRPAGTGDLILSWNAFNTSGTTSGSGYVYKNTGDVASSYEQNGAHRWYIAPSGTAGNAISFTQAMTLDASGNLLVGQTSITASLGQSVQITNGSSLGQYAAGSGSASQTYTFGRDNVSTGNFVFTYNGAVISSINPSTGVYTPLSDIRVKKNVMPLQYGLNEILQLSPVIYNMASEKDSDKKHIGLIAQQVKSVLDEAVDDLIDPEKQMYGLDKSVLVPVLVKAIQEQQAIIQTLTARVATLESN